VIWLLFRLSKEEKGSTSLALWIPTLWIFVGATRNLSVWFSFSGGGSGGYLEGNPLDQVAAVLMLVIGVGVLVRRPSRVSELLRSNIPVLLFFLYCGLSIVWSDFPEVSSKRWLRAVGDIVMVLVILTESNWLVAIRRVFSRIAIVSIPLSILFIRYYPELGRAYSRGGLTSWSGVATGKNGLGMICLVFGLATLFHFLQIYCEKDNPRRRAKLAADGSILVMTVYLLLKANSATSLACFFLAAGPMVLVFFSQFARKPAIVHIMTFSVLGIASSALFLNIGSGMVQSLGRDTTLTGRTDIWRSAFTLVQNPVFGTGFESFWLGERLSRVEIMINQSVNQAHDGYIEIYLNLGWVGVFLLITIIVVAYARVVTSIAKMTPLAPLGLALFIVNVAYNFTEAAFKMMHPLWISLFLITMAVAKAPMQRSDSQEDSPSVRAKSQKRAVRWKRDIRIGETARSVLAGTGQALGLSRPPINSLT
jgi:O-antigen ligase